MILLLFFVIALTTGSNVVLDFEQNASNVQPSEDQLLAFVLNFAVLELRKMGRFSHPMASK